VAGRKGEPGKSFTQWHLVLSLLLGLMCGVRAANIELRIDFSRTNGQVRALHGINRGPLVGGGMIDLTEAQRALNIPFNRLHDSHWPNSDVVDIHAVFPDFNRDPAKPESYDFARTDRYLEGVRKTGAGIVYRLGETIEHEDPKRFIHPPKDFNQWAQICLGVIRHYNEGWANGFHHGIRYWEIWNEPENRPACWTGTDEQFLALYATAARAIKTEFPKLKVGGPAFGYTGEVKGERFRAGGLVTNFLAMCRRESLPLDFLSWHCYTDDPREIVIRSHGMRKLLDAYGFTNTESHLNEWNYLPNKSWTPISKKAAPEARRHAYGEMAGESAAAFVASVLIQMQDAPMDMMNLFHGESGPFGLFDVHGVPEKNYYGLRAFAEFLKTPRRVAAPTNSSIDLLAGLGDRDTAGILISHRSTSESEINITCSNLPWGGAARAEMRVVGAAHNFEQVQGFQLKGDIARIHLRGPTVALISIRR
jgi:xylan 1,4-beta-xylosidase